jgi:hypothetical protein
MRQVILALTVAVMAGTTQARADLVSYNMSGTITYASGSSSFAVGDRVTWTLQYDTATRSTSGSSKIATEPWKFYQMTHTNIITNIVDQTNGYHLPLLPPIRMVQGGVGLSKGFSSGSIWGYESSNLRGITSYNIFTLMTDRTIPTVNLADFQLNTVHVTSNPIYSFFNYNYSPSFGTNYDFSATVVSISGGPVAPEPGTLTLFFLGAVGLAARGIRRSSGQVG